MKRRCDLCEFWEKNDSQGEGIHVDDMQGECRRFPPALNMPFIDKASKEDHAEHQTWEHESQETFRLISLSHAWCFPVTDGSSWCGEFQQLTVRKRKKPC